MPKHLDFNAEAFICEFQSAQEETLAENTHTHSRDTQGARERPCFWV